MRPFSSGETDRMQESYDGGMQDACIVLRWQPSIKAYLADADATPCRFRDATASPASAVFLAGATTPGARVVLPQSVALGKNDRIRLTTRWQRPIEPIDYQQAGAPELTALGLIVDLRKVAT